MCLRMYLFVSCRCAPPSERQSAAASVLLPVMVVVLGACLAVSWTAAFVWVLKLKQRDHHQQEEQDNELEEESVSVVTVT